MEIKKAIKRALTKKTVLSVKERDGFFDFEALTTSLFFRDHEKVFGLSFRGTVQVLKLKGAVVIFETEIAVLKKFDERLLLPFRVWRLDAPLFLEKSTLLARDWTELLETEETEAAEIKIRSCFERFQIGVGTALSKVLVLDPEATLLTERNDLPDFQKRIELYLSGLTAPEFRAVQESFRKVKKGYFGLFCLEAEK